MSNRKILLSLAFLLAANAFAQEKSVRPGVNDNFKDPDVDRYIAMFEGESREIYKHRVEIVDAVALKPGEVVADVGAGTGFFSMMFADRVGKEGKVFAVDIAKNFVEHIRKSAAEHGHANVTGIVCTDRSTELAENSIDAAFVCDTYHHFEFPFETAKSLHRALKPGGRLIVVDFERIVGVTSEFSIEHVRCGKGTVTDELKDSGFDFVREVPIMKEQYVIEFRKREPVSTP